MTLGYRGVGLRAYHTAWSPLFRKRNILQDHFSLLNRVGSLKEIKNAKNILPLGKVTVCF